MSINRVLLSDCYLHLKTIYFMASVRQLFLSHVAQTSEISLGLEVDRAEGMYIYDTKGKKYLDLNSGISVSSIGHRHPRVIKAIQDQIDRHLHTMVYGEHIQQSQVAMAKLLTDQLPKSLNSVYYFMSGTEVIEAAMKLAKRAKERYEIVACKNAYHGSTQGAESLRSDHDYSQAFLPLVPGIKHINFNNEDEITKITNRTAAVIVEPVQAEAGVVVPKNNYLKKLRARCTEVGALLILDEIQTGFGRTGHLFALRKYDIVPDILCLGKAMGGGMPIGAMVCDIKLMQAFTKSPMLGHITTFGGHPVSCAAAHGNLTAILDESIVESVLAKEKLFHKKLQHPIIKEVRSSGLMMAVELTKRKYLKHVVAHAMELGAIIDYFLFNNRSFRLAPPLIINEEEIELACDLLLKACNFAQEKYTST